MRWTALPQWSLGFAQMQICYWMPMVGIRLARGLGLSCEANANPDFSRLAQYIAVSALLTRAAAVATRSKPAGALPAANDAG